MCPCRCINHVFNGLVKKKVDDLGLNFFSLNIIIGENIEISMWKLNKMYDMGVQFLGNNENKKMVQNWLKFFTNDSLVHPCTLNIFPLYS